MTDFGWGLVLLGVYVLLVILARWLCIARANVVWNQAQSAALGKRLLLQLARASSTNGKVITSQSTLDELVQEINKKNPQGRFSGVVGWNGSHQIAQWVLMHEAERLALPTLRHEELVARLERALGQLDQLPQPRREAWQAAIQMLLATRDEAEHERRNRVYRAYLDELLGEIYEASNGNASQLAGLYNRATWVVLVALLPLAVLAGLGYGVVLIAGAIGGLVSRMQRLVFSKRIPIAYGSSWAPLFCAPILGALAAWTGLVLISLLQATGVLQLAALDTALTSLQAPSSAVLGVAILLGLSERFLIQLEKQAETVINPDRASPLDQHAAANSAAADQRANLLQPQSLLPPQTPAPDKAPPSKTVGVGNGGTGRAGSKG
jgi:hypothetical protein